MLSPSSNDITRTRYVTKSSLIVGTHTNGSSLKILAHFLQFEASSQKSVSLGRFIQNSFPSHWYLKSGNTILASLIPRSTIAKSPGTRSQIHQCWTLTATFSPVDFKTASWTWAKDAEATGSCLIYSNTSLIGFPKSSSRIFFTSSHEVQGACWHIFSNTSTYGVGTSISSYPTI